MTQVTPEEVARFRTQLVDYPDAINALQVIEDCEGNLEDAAMGTGQLRRGAVMLNCSLST